MTENMNQTTYTVSYNDERGNSAERTFTNREEAVILFHETAGIDYAGFPQDDADAFEHIGWETETREQRGITHIAEYTEERGNWNVTLYITIEHAPAVETDAPKRTTCCQATYSRPMAGAGQWTCDNCHKPVSDNGTAVKPVRMIGADIRPGMSLMFRDGRIAYIASMTPGPNPFVTRCHFNVNGEYRTGLMYAKTEYSVACTHSNMMDVPGLAGVQVCMSCDLKVVSWPGQNA